MLCDCGYARIPSARRHVFTPSAIDRSHSVPQNSCPRMRSSSRSSSQAAAASRGSSLAAADVATLAAAARRGAAASAPSSAAPPATSKLASLETENAELRQELRDAKQQLLEHAGRRRKEALRAQERDRPQKLAAVSAPHVDARDGAAASAWHRRRRRKQRQREPQH